jgi:peroxiredoxin
LRSFQQRLPDFNARGIRIAALTVDAPDVNRGHCQKLGFTFTVLSDPKTDVVRSYDLLHQGGGPNGADIARPAEFLLDSTGTVRWVNLTDSVTVRARPNVILKVIDDLKLPQAAGGQTPAN